MPGHRRKLAFALITVLIVLGAAEGTLRLAGFHYQPYPERIWLGRYKGGIPTADRVFDRVVTGLFTRDARLFWRPVPGKAPFNAAGLRDDEALPPTRPPGELRLLALGDSCTFLGSPHPWTERLEDHLDEISSRPVRVLNAGVPAWSSLQGRRYLEDPGLSFEPDVVMVYFGWNDHWRATVRPDAEFSVPDERLVMIQRFLSRSRLYQALNRVLKGGGPEPEGPPFAAGRDLAERAASRPFRVPLASFEENLRAMVDLAGEHGARTVFITAPSRLTSGSVPAYLLVHGFVARGGEPIETIHARYVAVVRRVARDTGSVLVDAAQEFEVVPDRGRSLLRDDGIHLTAAGMDRMAELIHEELRQAAIVPPGQ